jgi:hypothetical protein
VAESQIADSEADRQSPTDRSPASPPERQQLEAIGQAWATATGCFRSGTNSSGCSGSAADDGRDCRGMSEASRSFVCSPRQRATVAEEPAGRSIVRHRDRPYHRSGTVAVRAPAMPGHVRRRPAGADRVDEDAFVRQLGRQHPRERVARRLADAVGRRLFNCLSPRPSSRRGSGLLNDCGHGSGLRDIDRMAGRNLLNC